MARAFVLSALLVLTLCPGAALAWKRSPHGDVTLFQPKAGVVRKLPQVALGELTAIAGPEDSGMAKRLDDERIAGFHKTIKLLRAKKDVKGLQKLGEEIKAEWSAKKSAALYPVILEVCVALNSARTTEPGVDQFIQELVVAAIDSPAEKPAEVVAKLLLFLESDFDYSSGKLAGAEWASERAVRAERWLKVCKSVREQNAALPKPSGEVQLNVSPPEGLPSGVGPEAVKDPVLRKQFEEAIELNTRRHEANQKKRMFDDLEKDVASDSARYLVEAFSKPPFRTDDLAKLLAEYGLKQHRAAILKEVGRREAAETKRAAQYAKVLPGIKELAGKKLQYSTDGVTFRDVPMPFFVEKGMSLRFKSPFAEGGNRWQGSSGATGEGAVTDVKFAKLSGDLADFKTVTVGGVGGTTTAHVIVFDLKSILTPKDNFPGRELDAFGICEFVNLSYETTPPGIREADLGGLRWTIKSGGGDLYGVAGGVATYQCPDVAGGFVLDLQLVGPQFVRRQAGK